MRLLVITSVYPRHPADDQVPWMREAHRRLKEAGVDLEVLTPAHRGLKDHVIDGIPVHRFRYAPAGWEALTGEEGAPSKLRKNPFLKLLAGAYLWSGLRKLIELLYTRTYDLVEVHWPFPHALMALPAVWAGVPVIYHYHSAELKLAAQNRFSSFIFSLTLPWAGAHVANSSYTASLVAKLNPQLQAEVIPYGAAIATKETSPRTRHKKILFVGRHIERKGLRYLIEAMQHLDENFSLTIVGEGDETPMLKSLAGKDPRIHFVGRLPGDELAQAYATHDIFALPSIVDSRGDTEGLGVVLLEAISAGIPIVASRTGGIVDVIKDGQTGLLVEQKNPQELATAILRIGQDPLLAAQLAASARAHCAKYFSWEALTQKTLALYTNVCRKTSQVSAAVRSQV